jgi:uncharacterized protein
MADRVISVQGKGTATAEPDLVRLSFQINTLQMEYETAVTQLNERVDQLRRDVAEVGIDPKDLKTTSFDISPKQHWSSEEEEYLFLGFEAEHDLHLEMPLEQDQLNRTLMQLAQSASGATFSIYFAVKDQDILRKQVLADAVVKAKENAQTLAQSAGVQLGEILRIDYGWTEVRFEERVMSYDAAEMPCAPMPDIEPAEMTASDNVTVVWKII